MVKAFLFEKHMEKELAAQMKLFALILFVLTYALMIALPKHRPWVALTSAAVFLVSGIVPLASLRQAIDFNVLLMLAGTMGTVSLFIQSQMPNRMAEMILKKTPNVMWVAVAMSLFAGVVSAFVDNVATVLMIAPVGLAIAKKLGISPVAMLISIAVSSNLQGAATLVGDTTSIMLGGYAGMDFLDFFFMDGKASIFFAVELGALATVPVIMFLFRKHREPVNAAVETAVTDYFPTFLLLANIVLLITASFIPGKPALTNGFICTGLFLVGAVQSLIRGRGDRTGARTALLEIDYQTLCLLAGLFVVIAGITNAGIIDEISNFFVKLGGNNLFLLYTVIVWGSVLISAFVDNIPYVATMLPVVSGIALSMNCPPTVLYFGLLTGATLGGNLTPIGASANIAAIGILRKEGYEVSTGDFMRIGIPFTLVAVSTGYLSPSLSLKDSKYQGGLSVSSLLMLRKSLFRISIAGDYFGTTTSHLDIDRLSSEELIKNAVRQQYENLKSDFSRYELSIVWNRPLNHTFTLSTDIGWQHCRFRNHNYSDRITVGCSLKF